MSKLVNDLIQQGYLKSDPIIDAFSEMHRIEFVPEELAVAAEADVPLPIGSGQTISQPTTVAFMLELLDPQKGQNILDVGSGSGWTAALLSYIVGKEGKVTAIELLPKLSRMGEQNADKFGFVRDKIAEFFAADGYDGFPRNAPYDRIIVSAAADQIPPALQDQLKIGGKMVIPIHNSIWFLEKKSEGTFYKEEYPGFTFVPLVHVAKS